MFKWMISTATASPVQDHLYAICSLDCSVAINDANLLIELQVLDEARPNVGQLIERSEKDWILFSILFLTLLCRSTITKSAVNHSKLFTARKLTEKYSTKMESENIHVSMFLRSYCGINRLRRRNQCSRN